MVTISHKHTALFLLIALLSSSLLSAQERLAPLSLGNTPKHILYKGSTDTLQIPFFDDFSTYTGSPDPTLWDESDSYINAGFDLFPPTVGMATLDAYTRFGTLHHHATTSFFPADTLTSLPINLSTYQPKDSLAISFFYIPGGMEGDLWSRSGDKPDMGDSLVVEFFDSQTNQWIHIWATDGTSVDTLLAHTGIRWQYILLPITDERFFSSSFRFRFRNFCSLDVSSHDGMTVAGDQWHIDYVLLDAHRDSTETVPSFHDVAFVKPATSLLNGYTAVPYRQYDPSLMLPSLSLTITNLFRSTLATHYSYHILNSDNDTIFSYEGGYENAPSFLPNMQYQDAPAHAFPPLAYTFPLMSSPQSYRIVHNIREGSAGDQHTCNDTTTFIQHFSDYYAYDDGTAENGYGITSTASRNYIAYRFDLHCTDTLSALDLYFNPSYNDENANIGFYITIWDDDNGQPNNILYRDNERRFPVFTPLNTFHRYILENPIVVSGTIYVGIEQVGNAFINIGFDRNTMSNDRLFYLTSNHWQQSILQGSLMLRPAFGTSSSLLLPQKPYVDEIILFPNPTSDNIFISGVSENALVEIFNIHGQRLLHAPFTDNTISLSVLPKGVYVVRITTNNGQTFSKKIIKQ